MVDAVNNFKKEVDDPCSFKTLGKFQRGHSDPRIDPFKYSHRVIAFEVTDTGVTGIIKPLDKMPDGELLKGLIRADIPIWASYAIWGKVEDNIITSVEFFVINISTDLTGGWSHESIHIG